MDNDIITAIIRRYKKDRLGDSNGERAKKFEADLSLLCQYCTTLEDVVTILQELFGVCNAPQYWRYDSSSVKDIRYLDIMARAIPIQYLWQLLLSAVPPNPTTLAKPYHKSDHELASTLTVLTLTAKVLAHQRLMITTDISRTIQALIEPIIVAPKNTASADERILAVAVAYLSGLDQIVDTVAIQHNIVHPWQISTALITNRWQYYYLKLGQQLYSKNDLPALLAVRHGSAAVATIGQLVNESVLHPHVYLRALQLSGVPTTPEQLAILEQWYNLEHSAWVGIGETNKGKPLCRFIHQLLSSPAEVRNANLLRWLSTKLLPNIRQAEKETYGGLTCDDNLPRDVTVLPLLFPLEWRKPLALGLLNGIQPKDSTIPLSGNRNVWATFVEYCYRNPNQEQRCQTEDTAILARYLPEPEPTIE